MKELFTIGHSTHLVEKLIDLLKRYNISVVADVRSSPYSRYNPQFNRETLQSVLEKASIKYVFMGKELGARIDDPDCYIDGTVQFDKVAKTDIFQQGLQRLRKGIGDFKVCLLCAEKDPVMCHRTILVCKNMRSEDIFIKHILENGEYEGNKKTEQRLMEIHKIIEPDLFMCREELIEKAYILQAKKIAFTERQDE